MDWAGGPRLIAPTASYQPGVTGPIAAHHRRRGEEGLFQGAPGEPTLAAERGWTFHAPAAASRFLRVCGGNQSKAAHVLTKSLLWRRDFGVDALMAEPLETSEARALAIQPIFPMGVHSRRSRGGHAIYILRVGYAVPSAGRAS